MCNSTAIREMQMKTSIRYYRLSRTLMGKMITSVAGENAEKLDLSHIAAGNVT